MTISKSIKIINEIIPKIKTSRIHLTGIGCYWEFDVFPERSIALSKIGHNDTLCFYTSPFRELSIIDYKFNCSFYLFDDILKDFNSKEDYERDNLELILTYGKKIQMLDTYHWFFQLCEDVYHEKDITKTFKERSIII